VQPLEVPFGFDLGFADTQTLRHRPKGALGLCVGAEQQIRLPSVSTDVMPLALLPLELKPQLQARGCEEGCFGNMYLRKRLLPRRPAVSLGDQKFPS
jgi:hypothetical protein